MRSGRAHEPTQEELYYSMMTAHPIVGIYGFVYMAIMGAFYFLVPFLLGKEVRHKKLVVVNFFLQPIGVLICWGGRLLRHVQLPVHALLAAAGRL